MLASLERWAMAAGWRSLGPLYAVGAVCHVRRKIREASGPGSFELVTVIRETIAARFRRGADAAYYVWARDDGAGWGVSTGALWTRHRIGLVGITELVDYFKAGE